MRPNVLAVAFAAVLAGCSAYGPRAQPPGGALYCATDLDCPGERPGSCRQGVCGASPDSLGSDAGSVETGTRRFDGRAGAPDAIARRGEGGVSPCSLDTGCAAPEVCLAGTCVAPSWTNLGHSYMHSYCTSCHGSFGTLAGVQADVGRITYRIQIGNMPPAGHAQPTAEQNVSILRWLSTGPSM